MAYRPSSPTVGKSRNAKRSDGGEIFSFPMKAATTIWKGDLVMVDITDGLCWSMPSDDANCVDAGDLFAGVAAQSKTSVISGEPINVYVSGIFEMTNIIDAAAATNLGVEFYADNAVGGDSYAYYIQAGGATNGSIKVGRLMPPTPTATSEWRIRIDGYAGCKQAATSA